MRIFKSDRPNTFRFITTNTNNRTRIFAEERNCQILAETIDEIRKLHPFKLIGYVFMPDHLHMLINPLVPEVETIIRKIKGKSARRILDLVVESSSPIQLKELEVRRRGQKLAIWQPKASEVDIISVDWINQKLRYIHENPVRAGLCGSSVEWKWSSARAYGGEPGTPLTIDRTWYWSVDELRAAGWNMDGKPSFD